MNNEQGPNCRCENDKKDLSPEMLFNLTLKELPDREIKIKVAASSLNSAISYLTNYFAIEID